MPEASLTGDEAGVNFNESWIPAPAGGEGQVLSERKAKILKAIITEYISTAAPVGSKILAQKYNLGVSPATIRNEMAQLEEEGYIFQPHPSAGRVPTIRGYRYYVEALMDESDLPAEEKEAIKRSLQRIESEEQWLQLAAKILARLVRSLALVTAPQVVGCKFSRLELISLQDFLILLILFLTKSKLKKKVISVDESATQEELNAIARRLTDAFAGLGSTEIKRKKMALSRLERQIVKALVSLMEEEERGGDRKVFISGFSHLLAQPEYIRERKKALEILRMLEEGEILRSILSQDVPERGVRVLIGAEYGGAMSDCSLILSRYGVPDKAVGAIGTIGPARTDYCRVIPAVRFFSTVMSEVTRELYG